LVRRENESVLMDTAVICEKEQSESRNGFMDSQISLYNSRSEALLCTQQMSHPFQLFLSNTFHLLQIIYRLERAMFFSVFNDTLGICFADARKLHEFRFACAVDVDDRLRRLAVSRLSGRDGALGRITTKSSSWKILSVLLCTSLKDAIRDCVVEFFSGGICRGWGGVVVSNGDAEQKGSTQQRDHFDLIPGEAK